MPTPPQTGGPTPELFFQTANAYQRSHALKAAIDLDLFSAIAEGQDSPSLLAKRCGAAARGVRILADYLTIQGLLRKEGTTYRLTPESALFLDRKSPAYLGSALGFLHAPKFTEAFQNLTDAVRKGGTVSGDAGTVAPEHPLWVEFAKSMIPLMAKPAQEIALLVERVQPPVRKVLDVAAGAWPLRDRNCQTLRERRNCGARLAQRLGRCRGVCTSGRRAITVSDDRWRRVPARFGDRLRSRAAHEFPAPLFSCRLRDIAPKDTPLPGPGRPRHHIGVRAQ